MSFNHNFIEDLKNKLNIVDIIGQNVQLKKKGANYWGICPFHSEKTPSFSVNEEKQFYHCFGCGAGGDIIKFVQDYYKLDFNDAIAKICNDNGIELPKMTNQTNFNYKRYYEINKIAATYYLNNLRKLPNPGYMYISKRGISNKTLNKFGIGYSNDSWDGLYRHMSSLKIPEEELERIGLIKKNKNGKYYDKFRNRVIFPIINTQKKVIGFGGRSIINGDKGMPKYLNSDESGIFHKKNNLYGLNLAGDEVKKEGNIIIVEGYMDVISLYQAGVKNAIASLGTALTNEQARLLARYTKNVVLAYDSDNAGINATLRAIDILKEAKINVRVLNLNDAKDPDEYIRKFNVESFRNLIKEAAGSTDFRLNLLKKNYNLNIDEEALKYVKECIKILINLSPVERDFYIRKLANETNISEQAIRTEIELSLSDKIHSARNLSNFNSKNKETDLTQTMRLELYLLYIPTIDAGYIGRFDDDEIVFNTYLGKKIYRIEKELIENNLNIKHLEAEDIYKLLDPNEEEVYRKFINKVFMGGDIEEFYKECLNKYRLDYCIQRKNQLQNELDVYEKIGDKKSKDKTFEKILVEQAKITKLKGE